EIKKFQMRMGWKFKWVSSNANDFNYDFHVSATEDDVKRGTMYYNYDTVDFGIEDLPGTSVFYRDEDGRVFHTYSSYGRGGDLLLGAYNYLDITPKGRDEGGLKHTMAWLRHHDRYDDSYAVDPNSGYPAPEGARTAGSR